MALPKLRFAAIYEAGDAWLADCSAHPALVREAWDKEVLAPIRSGEHWLIAETPLIAAMRAINRIHSERRGPVLADTELDKAWWLMPLHASEELADVRPVTVHPPGWTPRCPPTGWHLDSSLWLNRPDGSGRLTDPAVLAAAFGPGSYRLPAEARG